MEKDNTTRPRISFYGGAGTVSGSNFLLEHGTTSLLVDCGLFHGTKLCEEENYKPFPYKPNEITALAVTHAHLDHIGRIPKLIREGFTGTIYSTPETRDMAEIMFEDALPIMEREARDEHKEPLYGKDDVAKTLAQWEVRPYHEPFAIGDFSVTLRDAGHILGSSMVEVSVAGETVVFTGDVGNSPAPLLRDTEPLTGATYAVVESVYGNRVHEPVSERLRKLEDVVEMTVREKGTLIIPAFSIERTQTLLYELNKLIENGRLPQLPVFLDSPLAIRITEVYKKSSLNFNEKTREIIASGDDIFNFPGLSITPSVEESKAINTTQPPKIIIAGSGMSTGGRILEHEKRYLPDPKSTILFVGFQAPGSLGRQVLDGNKEVEIDGKQVPVNAKVRTILGYSSHKDSEDMLEFVHTAGGTMKKVFVAMGEPRASQFLAQRLRDYLGMEAIVPKQGDSFML